MSGFLGCAARQMAMTLRLNFRSRQAVVYGYVMPVLFLLAFGGIFRGDTPLLQHEMGQLLVIGILGGACFGLPTALVAERERGVWRRYRLLPQPMGAFLTGVLLARLVLLLSGALLQVGLARLIYGTPLPLHPLGALGAFGAVAFAFLGLGILIASVADDVPAVQALGQCLFLPMILLGGVGVPLAVLPAWAQRASGFMPGRYAVTVLQAAISAPHGLGGTGFSFLALAAIGCGAGWLGLGLFRWESGRRVRSEGGVAFALALCVWAAVGAAAWLTGNLQPAGPAAGGYRAITEGQIESVSYDDLPGDTELATRLAPPLAGPARAAMAEFTSRLEEWGPGRDPDPVQAVRNLLDVAANADLTANLHEAEIARVTFDLLRARYPSPELERILAWIVLAPDDGEAVSTAPELGLRQAPPEAVVRERAGLYARKLLGRLRGRIPETGTP